MDNEDDVKFSSVISARINLPLSLQILQNDISAHGPSVDSVNEAGREVISSEGGAEARNTRDKLDKLNANWESVLAKTRDRQLELEAAHREVSASDSELAHEFPEDSISTSMIQTPWKYLWISDFLNWFLWMIWYSWFFTRCKKC